MILAFIMCIVFMPNKFILTTQAAAISAEEMARKFQELKAKYPEGSYWNGSYKVNGAEMSWQCMGWAETVCDYLFGENPRAWVQQTNFNNLCVGDHVRINNNGHSIVITNIVGDTIYYADCNAGYDGRVHWDKTMTRAQLISKTTWFKSQPNNWVRTLNASSQNTSSASPSSISEGIYNIACVDGGRYLNVYAGTDRDGTNVCVWDNDGSPEQKMKIVHRGGNKYALYPQSSNGRVIDANRGNSLKNPLQAGNNIDLWQTNDTPAQEWYFTDRGNGKYSIELAAASGLVISCDNPWSNNGNCSLQKYSGSNNQLWYLKRIDVTAAMPKPTVAPTPQPTVAPTPQPTVATTPQPVEEDNDLILTIDSKYAVVYGEVKKNDVAPIIRNERTMLPARFVAENLGARVSWSQSEQQVVITKGSTEIVLTIGLPYAMVNGAYEKIDCAPFIENERTYTPVRLIAEVLGADVEWESSTRSVIITR